MPQEVLGRNLHEEGHEELFSSGLAFVSQYVQEHDMNHVLWEGGESRPSCNVPDCPVVCLRSGRTQAG